MGGGGGESKQRNYLEEKWNMEKSRAAAVTGPSARPSCSRRDDDTTRQTTASIYTTQQSNNTREREGGGGDGGYNTDWYCRATLKGRRRRKDSTIGDEWHAGGFEPFNNGSHGEVPNNSGGSGRRGG